LLIVIPVTVVVFFAISAYSEIPDYPSQQTVPAVSIQQPSSPLSDLSGSFMENLMNSSFLPSCHLILKEKDRLLCTWLINLLL